MLDRNPSSQLMAGAQPYPTAAQQPLHAHPYGYGPAGFEDEGRSFNPLSIFFFVLRYRWLIAVLIAGGLAAGLVITWMQTPYYRATAKLEIMAPSAKVFEDMQVISETTDMRAHLTAAEKLKSQALAQRVVYELGLADQPAFLFPNPDFGISNLLARAFGRVYSQNINDYTPEQREQVAIGHVRRGLSVEVVQNTSLLAIHFSSQNPEYAAAIANQYVRSFIDQRVDQTSETSNLARQFIQEQVLQVKERLQESEKALVEYAKREGISTSGEETSLIASNIQSINDALSNAMQERLEFGRLVKLVEEGKSASLPMVIESEGIQKMQEKLADLRAEYQQKLMIYKPDFPEMQTLRARAQELERQVVQAIGAMADSIVTRYSEAQAKETDLRAKLGELESEQSAYQDKNIQYTILKREVDSNRVQYDSLISKLNEVGVSSELRSSNASIVDPAHVPGSPYSPRLLINLAIAIALALSLAAVIIYILELLNNTFTNPEQIETDLRLPVLGILPKTESADMIEDLANQQSGLSEAYRSLRTALQFTGTDGAPATLLVTSAEPGEGKSTTAFKLGIDFAALGANVLLIDADLRKPNLHRLFGMPNTLGLSNVLTNTLRPEDKNMIFRKTPYPNLTIMCSGTIPPNPADLLSSPKMGMIINACSGRFDMIIFDGPPVVGLADAPILSRLIETTILVVSAGQVTRKSAANALKRLQTAGGAIAGAVLTKFEANKFEYNYSYRYMNYEYYTYGSETPQLEGATREQSRDEGGKSIFRSIGTRLRDFSQRTSRTLYRNQ